MTLLNKITLIVFAGAVAGALLTGVVLYLILILAGVEGREAMRTTVPYTVLIGFSFIVPVFMIRWLIEKFILSKVKHMSEVINRISKGEIEAKVDIRSDDEIGRMAEAFERMRMSLKLLMSKVGGR